MKIIYKKIEGVTSTGHRFVEKSEVKGQAVIRRLAQVTPMGRWGLYYMWRPFGVQDFAIEFIDLAAGEKEAREYVESGKLIPLVAEGDDGNMPPKAERLTHGRKSLEEISRKYQGVGMF